MALSLKPLSGAVRAILFQTNTVALPTGALFGLTLSNDSGTPNTIIDIAAGSCRDSTDADNMVLGAFTKTTGSWAAGTGNGGLDTGSVANSTWYHVFVIKKPGGLAGAVDALLSTSATAPSLPSGYTLFRRIGSFKTNASAHILAFAQDGDRFRWALSLLDVSATNPGTSAVTRTLSTPLGVVTWADLTATLFNPTTASISLLLSSLDETDRAVSNPDRTLTAGTTTNQLVTASALVKTNTSSQIRSRQSASGASDVMEIHTFGWVDQRGRMY